MKCIKCGREIDLSNDISYCPYCSNKLEGEPGRNKNIFTRDINIGYGFKAFVVWFLLCAIFSTFFVLFEEMILERIGIEISEPFIWIIIAIMIAGAGLYFTLAYVVYNHAKIKNRRAVAWATAFIVFTPLLGGLLYLLSWPKE